MFSENEGKSVQLNYDVKLKLVALTQQATHGKLCEDQNLPPLGALDVIGRDRRNAWALLGDLSKEDSMVGFIDGVADSMPHLKPYIEAIKKEKEFTKQQEEDAQEKAAEEAKIAKEADEERQRQEEQRRQIQDALNSQSYNEFRKYAEQQYPDNPDQQAVLIRQLQEQHYYQYMQQAYQQQQTSNPESTQVDLTNLKISHDLEDEENLEDDEHDEDEDDDEEVVVEEDEEHFDYDQDDDVAPASMWTKKELQEFKDSIRKEGGDSIIKVNNLDFGAKTDSF